MNEEIFLVIVGGGIGILGSVATAFVVSYLDSEKDRKNYLRKKYEELLVELNEEKTSFLEHYLKYLTVFEGKMELRKLKSGKGFIESASRKIKIEMLVALYAKEIDTKPYYLKKKEFNSLINKLSTGVRPDELSTLSEQSISDFHKARNAFEEVRNVLFSNIINQCGKI